MSNDIFSRIRSRAQLVAQQARWVRINYDALSGYAELLELDVTPAVAHTQEHHLLGRGDDTLAYFLVLDSINFGSGYFPFLAKDRGASGYFTVARRLKEWFLTEGVPTPERLQRLRAEECGELFGQDMGNPHAQELMELFALALSQLGTLLCDAYEADYTAMFARAHSAADLVEAMLRMPFFRDVAYYGDFEVPFLKRAQILIQDVTIAEPSHALLQFADVDRLTPFADNVLPYVLKADGILSYHEWLAERINNEELIASGSFEEIEIRACTVYALDLLNEHINQHRPMTLRELDFQLWNRGQKLKRLVADRRHRTRCVYY